jgi:replication factor A1
VSRARVNIAKKQFSNVNNEYEIMFENSTEIDPVSDGLHRYIDDQSG